MIVCNSLYANAIVCIRSVIYDETKKLQFRKEIDLVIISTFLQYDSKSGSHTKS